ncbi:MAG TPA: fibronectin type III domain-containing protein [Chloroflexia bacterium]|jgi:hypothetical protein
MDIRRQATNPGGRVGALILAIMLLVVSSGMFAGQHAQAAAPSDKVVAQPAQQTVTEAKRFSKYDLPVGGTKPDMPGDPTVGTSVVGGGASPLAMNNYVPSRTTGITYSSISGTGTSVTSWGNSANTDDNLSNSQPIGFTFIYNGQAVTQFRVSTNGYVTFNTTTAAVGSGTGAYGYSNPAFSTSSGCTCNALAPFYDDQQTAANAGTLADLNASIKYRVTGTAGSRVLTVEWINFQDFSTTSTASLNYQVKLYEADGHIEFVYGTMTSGAASWSYTLGINAATISATPTAAELLTQQTANSATFSNTVSNALATVPATNSMITFTPPAAPAAPTNLTFSSITASSMTLNWTDNATSEIGYLIYVSTDGTNYALVTQTAANATSANITGLSPSTTYFWRVQAVSEGALSGVLSGSQATAAPGTITANALTGNWSAPATWSGGVVPTANDNVVIPTGAVVTIDTAAVAYSVTVNTGGVLQYEATTARTLTVTTSVTVDTGGTFQSAVTGTQVSHVLSVGTNLTNNGTLDFSTNTDTAGAGITFTGVVSSTFGGTGTTTDIRAITINKGTTSASILELNTSNFTVRGVNTDVAGYLTLTNGTFKISGTFTMANRTFTTATYTIPATGGIWLNNPNYTVSPTASSSSTSNNGLFRITAGTYNIGIGVADQMRGGTGAVFTIEGGTINVSGAFDPQSAVTYTQTGGTVNVGLVGNNVSAFGTFELFSSSSIFNMSGGTINIVQPSTGATKVDYRVNSSSGVITGGTLNIGTGATAAGSTFNIVGSAPSIVVDSTTSTKTATLTGTLFNLGNMTIGTGSALILNGFTLYTYASTFTNNGTLTGSISGSQLYMFGTGALTYTGTGVVTAGFQTLSIDDPSGVIIGSATSGINALRVNLFTGTVTNSNKLTIGNGGTTSATVQIGAAGLTSPGGSFDSAPTFNAGSGGVILIYAQESVGRTTGFEVPSTRTVQTVTVSNTNGVTLAGGDLTIASTGTALTLTAGRLITGPNTIILSSATATVTRTSGYVDGNFRKNYAAAAAKTFEVGTANGYSPVVVTTTVASTFPALFTAKAVQGAMPSVPAPTLSLQRYWTLTATGVTADLLFTYLDPTDLPPTATEANLSIFKFDGTVPMQQAGTINTTNNTFVVTGVSSFSDWTLSTIYQWASTIEGAGASLAAPSVFWDNATPTPNTFITTGGNSNMVRGLNGAGGILWSQNVGGAVQDRGPIINIGGTNVSFFTSQNGWVNALRATDGTSFWPAGVGQIASTVVAGVGYQPNVAVVGGPTSLIFAGTFTDTTLTNRMVALNALTGAQVWSFDNSANGGLGTIPTGPAVDWASNTLYFGTNNVTGPVNGRGDGTSNGPVGVWALNTTNGSVRWSQSNIGAVVNSFPTISRDGQTLYVGTVNAGVFTLYALRTSDGAVRASFQAPGGVGDFRGSPWLWPNSADPANTDIYATAGDRVYAFTDTPATTGTLPFKSGWATGFATVPGAGTPLFLPSTNHLYVGGNNGNIYKINAGNGVIVNQFFMGAVAAVSDLTYDYVRNTFYLTTNGKLYSVVGNW